MPWLMMSCGRHRRELLGDGAVDALVVERETGASVLRRIGEAGKPCCGQLALEGAGAGDVAAHSGLGVLREERVAALGEGVRLLGGEGGARHRCSVFAQRLVLYGDKMYAPIQL